MPYRLLVKVAFAADFKDERVEKADPPYRRKVTPLTIEQNAITSFKSRTTLVPCRANTIGPGLILQADYAVGGCDGALSRGMQWQGMSFLTTLRYGHRYVDNLKLYPHNAGQTVLS